MKLSKTKKILQMKSNFIKLNLISLQ